MNAGPLIADRDHVCQFHATLDDDGWWFSSATPVTDERFPEVKNVVRMVNHDMFKSREYEEDGVHYVHMVGFSETDMKGYIPASLLNMANANGIYKFFNSMMKELNSMNE